MGNQSSKTEHLNAEIRRSLLLSPEDKKYWLDQIEAGLPDTIIDRLSDEIIEGNKEIDSYIDAAIVENPNNHYLNEIKEKATKIKKKAFDIDESSQKTKLEKKLEQQLEDI